jgi:hypothetical protein
MNPRQTAKTTFLFTLSFLLLLLIVVGTSSGHAAQARTTKPSQPANAVSPAPTTSPPNSQEIGKGPEGACEQNQKDATTSVRPPLWTVDQGIKEFRWVFGLMTGALVLILVLLTIALVHISRSKERQWSLGDALSEESSVQPPPAEIHGRGNVIMLASASRLIALVGLLAAVPVVIGVGYAITWNLIVNGACPDLSGVRAWLIGISLAFAPYLANQVRSIFDPRVGTPQTPTTVSQVPVQPTPPPAQGQGTIPSPHPIPQPSPTLGPTTQAVSQAGIVRVSGAHRIPVTEIGQVHALSPHLDRLKKHGFRTTHQLVGVARAAEGALAEFLNLNQEQLHDLLRKVPHYAELSAAYGKPQPKFPMGARPARIPRRFSGSGTSGLASPPPTSGKSLISHMPPVRDQGLVRQTCVAFAALAVFEHYLTLQNGGLSAQFLYWDCKQNDGIPNTPGTQLGLAMGLLERDGCCTDATWQYNASPMPGNEGEGPAPVAAMTDAANYKIGYYNLVVPSTVILDPIDAIRSELGRDRCVAFTIPIFQSSYNNENVRESGNFIDPLGTASDLKIEDHSMCFVGYQDDASDPASGGGKFYVRNSWDQWATQSQLGMGYGTISYNYIASWCTEAYSIN